MFVSSWSPCFTMSRCLARRPSLKPFVAHHRALTGEAVASFNISWNPLKRNDRIWEQIHIGKELRSFMEIKDCESDWYTVYIRRFYVMFVVISCDFMIVIVITLSTDSDEILEDHPFCFQQTWIATSLEYWHFALQDVALSEMID